MCERRVINETDLQMKKWLKQYRSITQNSFVVLVGDPLFLIMHIFILGTILLIASLPGFTLGGQLKLVRDQIVALTFVCSCLLAVVSAGKIVGDDLRKGMIPTILSRPVPASALLIGKWTGLVLSLLILFLSSTVAGLWGTRLIFKEHSVETLGLLVYLAVILISLGGVALHHYIRGGNYFWQSNLLLLFMLLTAFLILNFYGYNGSSSGYGVLVDWRTACAFLYLYMALMIFSAMAVLCSVIMDVSMLMAVSVVIFFLGLFSDYVLGLLFSSSVIRAIAAVFVPDWQMFWVTERLNDLNFLLGSFFWSHMFHAIFQSILLIVLASILFNKKEVSGTV